MPVMYMTNINVLDFYLGFGWIVIEEHAPQKALIASICQKRIDFK